MLRLAKGDQNATDRENFADFFHILLDTLVDNLLGFADFKLLLSRGNWPELGSELKRPALYNDDLDRVKEHERHERDRHDGETPSPTTLIFGCISSQALK